MQVQLAQATSPALKALPEATRKAIEKELLETSEQRSQSIDERSATLRGLDPVNRAVIASELRVQLVGVGSIFAFGLVAFGFLCMGPVNIAVDSYGR